MMAGQTPELPESEEIKGELEPPTLENVERAMDEERPFFNGVPLTGEDEMDLDPFNVDTHNRLNLDAASASATVLVEVGAIHQSLLIASWGPDRGYFRHQDHGQLDPRS